MTKERLPIRDDVKGPITYRRNPTEGEIRMGYGATHYRDFELSKCLHRGTRILKRWLKADDGLRYYR